MESFYRFRKTNNEDAYKYETRTKAGIIRDLIIDAAQMEFGSDENIKFLTGTHDKLMMLDNKYILRFKKFNEDLTTSNFQTPRAQAYVEQFKIDGIPSDPLRLEIGYLPDSLITEIKGIYIVRLAHKIAQWYLRLDDSDIELGIPGDAFDAIIIPPIEVRLKSGIRRKDGTNDANG